VLAALVGVAALAIRRSAPDLLSFSGLACAPAAAWLAFGLAGGLAVACPALILAGHALRPARG
jgi:hypothetical protein